MMLKSAVVLLALFTAQELVSASTLLGTVKCTYGPSYWCANLDNAKECSATQHCIENTWSKKPVNHVHDYSTDSSVCTFCKDIVSDLQEFIANNETRATILQYMERACQLMPDDFSQTECEKIGTHYLDEVLAMIEAQVVPDTICTLVKLCGTQHDLSVKKPTNKFSVKTPPKVGFSLCDACKDAELFVKGELDNKDNQAVIQKLFQSECEKLGGDLAPECEQVITILMPELISFLDQTLSSDQLCVMLTMCDSSDDVLAAIRTSIVSHLRKSSMKTHLIGLASRVGADECTTCQEIFNYIHIFMNNNGTEQEVQQFVETELCGQMGALADTCKELVDSYFPQIWETLLSLLDPKTVCTELHLCTASSDAVKSSKPEDVEFSIQCELCEYVMRELESLITKNSTEAEIEAALEKVCGLLPASMSDECDQFVDKYTKEIVKFLMDDLSPQMICATLGLCSTSRLQVGSAECIICEMALAYIKSDISKPTTQQEIMQDLDKLCSKLSKGLSAQCVSVVKQFGPDIMKILSDDVNPDQLCAEIGVCTSGVQKGKVDGLVHLYNDHSRLSNV